MKGNAKLSASRNARGKLSAVSTVEKSGLKLVRERRRRGRVATMREYAKLDWESWAKTDKPGPSAELMDQLGFYSRLSAAIMMKTKAELIEVHTDLEHKEVDKLLAGLMDTDERLKALASITESAYIRLLAAASAHYLSGGKIRGFMICARKSASCGGLKRPLKYTSVF